MHHRVKEEPESQNYSTALIRSVMAGPHSQSCLSRMVSLVSQCITKKAVVSAFLKILMAAGEVKASTEIHMSVYYRRDLRASIQNAWGPIGI